MLQRLRWRVPGSPEDIRRNQNFLATMNFLFFAVARVRRGSRMCVGMVVDCCKVDVHKQPPLRLHVEISRWRGSY